MQETGEAPVWSLAQEDPLKEENGNPLQYFMDGRAWKDTVQRSAALDMIERLTTHTTGGLEEENFWEKYLQGNFETQKQSLSILLQSSSNIYYILIIKNKVMLNIFSKSSFWSFPFLGGMGEVSEKRIKRNKPYFNIFSQLFFPRPFL